MPIRRESAKAKGRVLQQWVCKKIAEIVNLPYGKDELIASREGGQTGTDIRLIGEARQRFPFSVECKFQESWSVLAWIDQARDNQIENTDWLLVLKKSRISPVVVMDANRFFALMSQIFPSPKI